MVVDAQTAGVELPMHLALAGGAAGPLMRRTDPVPGFDGLDFVVPGAGWRRTLAARLWVDGGRGLGRLRLVWQSPERTLLVWRGLAALGDTHAEARAVPITPETAALIGALTGPDAAPLVAEHGIYLPGFVAPAARVFEVVPGAKVVGTAAPGAAVILALKLRPTHGEPVVWRQDTRADARGDYLFWVPYGTDRSPPGAAVTVEGQYVLLVGGAAVGRVDVPDAAVQRADPVLLGRRWGAPPAQ